MHSLKLQNMLGALVYILHVVIGGMLWKGYNHLMQPISDPTAQGAPDRVLLEYFIGAYGVFSVIFTASAFMYVRKAGSKLLKAGLIIFLFMHIVSMTYGLFPEDLLGSPIIILIAGGISVFLAVYRMNYFGLFERINIGSLQLWMFLLSLKLFTSRIGMRAY